MVLASAQDPGSITADGTNVYWAELRGAERDLRYAIKKVSTNGGAPVKLFSLIRPARSLACDGDHLYWAGDADVVKAPIGGGTPTTLAAERPTPSSVRVDKTSVYWFEGLGWGRGAIMKVPIGGGAAFTIASAQSPRAMAVGSDGVYWTDYAVYTADRGPEPTATVKKAPLDGGAPVTLVMGNFDPGDVAVDGTSVFWLNASTMNGARLQNDGALVKASEN